MTQLASFTELFVWLLVVKGFLLPLFIIPTGSMAPTLKGAYAAHTCPNCAIEYPVRYPATSPPQVIQCPNCRQQEATVAVQRNGVRLDDRIGDRVAVHGWPYALGGSLRPERWDVVVFRNPNLPSENYIKRLIGLPDETIEIIDGDIWVTRPGAAAPRVARKPQPAQEALWIPYYDHDHRPLRATKDELGARVFGAPRWAAFAPRFAPLPEAGPWEALETRTPTFRGLGSEPVSLQFATAPPTNATLPPAEITDFYSYNAFSEDGGVATLIPRRVSDVRIGAEVTFHDGSGYVELMVSKYDDYFFARLYADGRLTLEHADAPDGSRTQWSTAQVALAAGRGRISLGHADYQVAVAINGERVLTSTDDQYAIPVAVARARAARPIVPVIRIAAADVACTLAHLRVERDVHYRAIEGNGEQQRIANGGLNNPIDIGPAAYYVLGDNSPASLDSRWWTPEDIGPHLQDAFHAGDYRLGTVPADQMIGRAFLVYWPGFLPLLPNLPHVLPDLGRVRWIH